MQHQNFSLAHPGKLLKNQLVRQKINLFSDERMSVKVFIAHGDSGDSGEIVGAA